MISRYLYLAAGLGFVVATFFELRSPRNLYAAVLDIIAGAIFLYLGFIQPKPRARPPR